MYVCLECGKKFKTAAAAQRAANSDRGCPRCGGCDIDLDVATPPTTGRTDGYVYGVPQFGSCNDGPPSTPPKAVRTPNNP